LRDDSESKLEIEPVKAPKQPAQLRAIEYLNYLTDNLGTENQVVAVGILENKRSREACRIDECSNEDNSIEDDGGLIHIFVEPPSLPHR